MMDAKRIEEIRQRAEAATEGPWEYVELYDVIAEKGNSKDVITGDLDRTADALFIAHAREDIPALLAEVERLRVENEEMRIKLDVTDQSAEAVEAENERLRAIIADFADYGTRHDTNPTIGGVIKSRDDIAGWVAYMRSMDENVRRRAKEALGE